MPALSGGFAVMLTRQNAVQWMNFIKHLCIMHFIDFERFLSTSALRVEPWMEETRESWRLTPAGSPGRQSWPFRSSGLARAGLEGLSLADLQHEDGATASTPTATLRREEGMGEATSSHTVNVGATPPAGKPVPREPGSSASDPVLKDAIAKGVSLAMASQVPLPAQPTVESSIATAANIDKQRTRLFSTMIMHISPDLQPSFQFFSSPQDIWNHVSSWLVDDAVADQSILSVEWFNIVMGAMETPEAYFLRGKALAIKLFYAGVRMDEKTAVFGMLKGVQHDRFRHLRQTWGTMQDCQNIKFWAVVDAFVRADVVYMQYDPASDHFPPYKRTNPAHPPSPAMYAGGAPAHGQRAPPGGSTGGRGAGGSPGQSSQKLCGFCQRTGHLEDTCWKKYPHLAPTRGGARPAGIPQDFSRLSRKQKNALIARLLN